MSQSFLRYERFFTCGIYRSPCIIGDMITRTKLASAGLAAAVALGGLVAAPVASAQGTSFNNSAEAAQATAEMNAETNAESSSIKDLSSSSTTAEGSSLKDTDPDTVLDWLGVVTAGLSVIATVYTLINSMGNNAQFRF